MAFSVYPYVESYHEQLNTPKIQPSLLAPGYSVAAVLANESTEATGNVCLSALIELGLGLFALIIVSDGAARLLILATTEKGTL